MQTPSAQNMKIHPLLPLVVCNLSRRTFVRVPTARRRVARISRPGFMRAIGIALLLGICGAAGAEGFAIGGTGAALGTMRLLADEFSLRNPDISVTTMPSLGSRGGVNAVVAGAIGLAVTARTLNEGERKLGAIEIEYARTPFVFATSAASGVTAITRRELADIYSGKMTAWADGSQVRVVLRPIADANTEMMKNMSEDLRLGLLAAYARPGVRVSVSDQDAANSLEKIAGAIGPSTLGLILSEGRALRSLKLDGVEPTPANSASGAYPYQVRLYMVTGVKRAAAVERFIAFVQSPAGKKILVRHGHWFS